MGTNLSGAFVTLHQFKADLPNKLITNTAKKIAAQRILEMDQVLSFLNQETLMEKHYKNANHHRSNTETKGW